MGDYSCKYTELSLMLKDESSGIVRWCRNEYAHPISYRLFHWINRVDKLQLLEY